MVRPLTDSWPTPGRMRGEPETAVSGQTADLYPFLNGPLRGRWPTVNRQLADRWRTTARPYGG
jgi:hypothetical protein